MKNVFITLIVLFSLQNINAQYTEVINSKRPGLSESPYGIGTKVFQMETGMFYQKNQLKNIFIHKNNLLIIL